MSGGQRWLIDKSALRLHDPMFAAALIPRVAAGRVAICWVTELEVGFSARSAEDYARLQDDVLASMVRVVMPVAAEARSRQVQAALVAQGTHRGVAIPDLVIAAVAEIEGLTVLHHDRDFDLIAAVTAQPTEWVLPPA